MCEKVKCPSLNPFPFFFLLILLILLSIYSSERAFAEERQIFCSDEQIQNFEDMGLNNESDIFYFLSDNLIYRVYSWYSDDIYYNDSDYNFKVNQNYMTIGNTKDGTDYIVGYSSQINMYDYENACILHVNDNKTIIVENKLDTFLTNNGFEIINEYDVCENKPLIYSVPCYLIISNNNVFSYLLQNNNYFLIIVSVFAIGVSIALFFKIREVL